MPVASPVSSGELRHRVTIVSPTGTQSDTGGTTPGTPTTVASDVPAAVSSSLFGTFGEALKAGQLSAAVTHVVRIRYRAGLKPSMQVLYEGRTLEIVSVIDPDERHIELQLACAEAL